MGVVLHGGRLDAAIEKYGGERPDWLDLSTGINPIAYPLPEISPESWQRLPGEAAVDDLIKAAKHYYKTPNAMGVVAANGTQAIIQNLPSMLPHQKVAIVSPTYEEHKQCWEMAEREVFQVDQLDEALAIADIVIVVNPNNPTGKTYKPEVLLDAAKVLYQRFGFLIVDEAFGDCMPELSIVPQMLENVIVLRSFGKFFGLAGLRLGFAISSKTIADELNMRQGPWGVSGPALSIGAEALSNDVWAVKMRKQIMQNSKDQMEVIEACGLHNIGNAGLFMEFDHSNAVNLYEALLKEYILVRQFLERKTRLRFGLCKNMEELERLAWVLKNNV